MAEAAPAGDGTTQVLAVGDSAIVTSSVKVRRPAEYMLQLDALRAIAVFAVMIEHFVHEGWIRDALPWGMLGVRLFFVLSGFLITGILIRCRQRLESGNITLRGVLRTFFARRFLRLMPVYYVYLAAAAVLLPYSREHLGIFALYAQNFLFAVHPELFAKLFAHFWSLAVEEQFYLTWPFVILLTPRRALVPVVAALVLAGPVLRGLGLAFGFGELQIDMMMPAHVDTLGLGGLLAVLQRGSSRERRLGRGLVSLGLYLGLPSVCLLITALHFPALASVWILFAELAMGLLFTWVVAGAARGVGGPVGAVLASPVLTYLGRISYGIYVYHFNVPGLVRTKLAPLLGLPFPSSEWGRYCVSVAITVGIAALSWRWLEQPLGNLKRYFEYEPAAAVGNTGPSTVATR